MKTKFDVFLSQIELTKNKKLTKEILEEVIIDNDQKTWEIHLLLPTLFSVNEICDFIEKIKIFFKVDPILEVIVKIRYISNDYSKVDMFMYFEFIINLLSMEKARFSLFKNFKIDYLPSKYIINVDKESLHLAVYKEIIIDKFLEYGIVIDIDFNVCNNLKVVSEEIKDVILTNTLEMEKKIKEAKNQIVLETPKKPQRFSARNEACVSISEIPMDNLGLVEYKNTKALPYFTIQGEVFNFEIRLLPKSRVPTFLATFNLTDNTDSILVQKFANRESDIELVNKIKNGSFLKVSGKADFNTYKKDIVIEAEGITILESKPKVIIKDKALEKRVELHVHTNMSNLDGVCSAEKYLERAKYWEHKAIAFTDHDGVYAYPEINKAVLKYGIKPIYGLETSLVDEENCKITYTNHQFELAQACYVVFDIETTGLSAEFDDIIEISGIKYQNGTQIDSFSGLINPNRQLTSFIIDKTGITNELLQKEGKTRDTILKQFYTFSKGSVLVAHNAQFDVSHLYANYRKMQLKFDEYPIIDTLMLARVLYEDKLKRFDLGALTKHLKIKLVEHHRALADATATLELWIIMMAELKKLSIHQYQDINSITKDKAWKMVYPNHFTILVKNQKGLKNLYKVLSDALTNHFHKTARVTKNILNTYREGLLIGSGCVNGEIFEYAINRSYDDLLSKVDYYDYLEVQPPSAYNHLKVNASIDGNLLIQEAIKKIIKAGKQKKKIVVASNDCHYLDPEDQKYRDIYLKTPVVGGGLHSLEKYPGTNKQHFMSTDEMLKEFSFLDQDLAYEIVVKNTNLINDMIENIAIFPKKLYALSDHEFNDILKIQSIEEEVKKMVKENVHQKYGNPLPLIVQERLDKELNSIINNHFSSVYYISHLLVKKSLEEGYLVGSRGSVGSSFVATLMNITEVNPLSPHYLCPKCHFSSFKMNAEEKFKYGVSKEEKVLQEKLDKVESGYDLPDTNCPICKTKMLKDGHDIPFETFLGFKGDKVPDIDLNFSGDYQNKAHDYVKLLMGDEHAFRAGTISTVAERTAFGYVKGYLEKTGIVKRDAEIARIAKAIEGVKRSTGQHPGGIVVVPKEIEIYDITPIQYPADDCKDNWRTTHFDYHSFESNLLKLDILGHDDPTVIKFMMDYVYKHPLEFPFSNPYDIPLTDPLVIELFNSTKSLNLNESDILSEVASYAVPEFGTNFVRQMLKDTLPKNFSELVKISGLSHGTNVWLNNASDLVLGNNKDFGKILFKDVIGCRDDIMVYLTYQGLEPEKAFEIMEFVRRGKPKDNPEKWSEYETYMRAKGVPSWYIWSCSKIEYMFPKAHATAYVIMALRIAWFKVYKPLLFYSAYFSKRATQFDIEIMCSSANGIKNRIIELQKGTKYYDDSISNDDNKMSAKKSEDLLTVLFVALEMTKRGYKFKMVDIEKSAVSDFIIDDMSLICPFITIDGLGISAANSIVCERETKPFLSKNDCLKRTKINKTVFEKMDNLGVFNQLKDDSEEIINDLFMYANKI